MALFSSQCDNPNAAYTYYHEDASAVVGTHQLGTGLGIQLDSLSVEYVTSATVGNRRLSFRVTNLVLGQIFFLVQSPILQPESVTYNYYFVANAPNSMTGTHITIGIPVFKWYEPLYVTIIDTNNIATVSDTMKIAYCGKYVENSRRI